MFLKVQVIMLEVCEDPFRNQGQGLRNPFRVTGPPLVYREGVRAVAIRQVSWDGRSRAFKREFARQGFQVMV